MGKNKILKQLINKLESLYEKITEVKKNILIKNNYYKN